MICQDEDRGLKIGGKAYSQILDPIGDYLVNKGLRVVRVKSFDSKISKRGLYKIDYDAKNTKRIIKWRQRILYFFKNRHQKLRQKNINFCVYKNLIKKFDPALILTISPTPEFCMAARRMNKTLVEVGHGFGAPDHSAFHAPAARAKNKKYHEPNYFICFDTNTYKVRKKGDHGRFCETILTKQLRANRQASPSFSSERQNILVTLSWGYDGEKDWLSNIIPDGIMPEELQKIILNDTTKRWLIRFHPVHTRNKSKWAVLQKYITQKLKTSRNNVLDVSFVPIEEVLSVSDLHITLLSGASYEAAFFGVPTIALCPTLAEGQREARRFEDLVFKGLLKKVPFHQSDLLDEINKSLEKIYLPVWENIQGNVGELILTLLERLGNSKPNQR